MTIEEMQKRKKELGYSNEVLAEKSGVPLGTVQKIFGGLTKAPRQRTVEALEHVLGKRPELITGHAWERARRMMDEPDVPLLREGIPSPDFDRQGQYTIDDYYALPDERQVELIDGVFYDMGAPTKVHQMVILEMAVQLYSCVAAHPGCQLFVAPLDVRLDNDNYTMVQPDVLIICEDDGDKRRVNGAPDFVAEVVSPTNRAYDQFLKLNKYRGAGVREYWLVDPAKKKVIVYRLEDDDLPESYSFSDKVPLGISEGRCAVDFSVIDETIRRYE